MSRSLLFCENLYAEKSIFIQIQFVATRVLYKCTLMKVKSLPKNVRLHVLKNRDSYRIQMNNCWAAVAGTSATSSSVGFFSHRIVFMLIE